MLRLVWSVHRKPLSYLKLQQQQVRQLHYPHLSSRFSRISATIACWKAICVQSSIPGIDECI